MESRPPLLKRKPLSLRLRLLEFYSPVVLRLSLVVSNCAYILILF